mgnify:CR=1 FL=1
MKKLNIFAMEIKCPSLDKERIRVFDNLREAEYEWPDRLFHRVITNKINFNFEYNNVSSLQELKKFSDNNIPYVVFVKFYEFRQIVGKRLEEKEDEKLSLMHYLFSSKDNQFIIDDINSDKCKFIIAGLTELSNQDYRLSFSIFNKQIKKYNLDESKITFFDWINNIEHMKKYNQNIKFKYFNWLMVSWNHYLNFPKTHKFFSKHYRKQKRFISLNHSIKLHRFLLIDFLRKKDLYKLGFISFFHKKFKQEFFNDAKALGWTKKEANEFYEWLNLNPLSVDIDLDYDYQTKLETNSSAPNEIFNEKTDKAYRDSYFNILTETCFFDGSYEQMDEYYLNERNVLPINTFQPFIVLNGKGHMKQFNRLGFKSFHPYIDESYDSEKEPSKRFKMITKEIERLCHMSDDEIHDWYWSMEEILIHNYNHFHNEFLPKQIQGFYDELIFE